MRLADGCRLLLGEMMHHTDTIHESDIDRLLAETSGPCVSILLPTTPVTPETDRDRIELKNGRGQAFGQLQALGLRRPDAEAILRPIDELLEDDGFWPYLSDGLAVFVSPRTHAIFRLPFSPLSSVRVGDRFVLRSLLPLLTDDGVFHVLALSQNQARLFEGTRHHVSEIVVEELPASMAKALALRGREGIRTPNRLWQGDEGQKNLYRKYFRQVDRALRPLLGHDQHPLVVASVDHLLPIYREVSTHGQLVDVAITGNPDHSSAAELHARAWPLVEPILARPRQEALASYRAKQGSGLASDDLATILAAATDGRIDSLFLSLGSSAHGRFDRDTRTLTTNDTPAPGDVDLHGQAARWAYRTGARIFVGEPPDIPEGTTMAAVFRYG